MAIKKTALYSSLWASCDELCGSMDDICQKLESLSELVQVMEGNRR